MLRHVFLWQDMYAWPNMSLDDMNTTLALEQFIQQTVRKDPADIEAIIACPDSADDSIWQYEQIRYISPLWKFLFSASSALYIHTQHHPDVDKCVWSLVAWPPL
jgi:hypothetical protein